MPAGGTKLPALGRTCPVERLLSRAEGRRRWDASRTLRNQCDGVRCDMSILLIKRVFRKTWGSRAGKNRSVNTWVQVIEETRARYPDFAFIAEAYWDLEWGASAAGLRLPLRQAFDDRLIHESADTAIRLHLSGDPAYQHKLVRFIENHDEPRSAATLDPEKAGAASVVVATLPGARLFYDGQFEGRKVKLPVQLGRQPEEYPDRELRVSTGLYSNP